MNNSLFRCSRKELLGLWQLPYCWMATATQLYGYCHTVVWLPPHCWMASAIFRFFFYSVQLLFPIWLSNPLRPEKIGSMVEQAGPSLKPFLLQQKSPKRFQREKILRFT